MCPTIHRGEVTWSEKHSKSLAELGLETGFLIIFKAAVFLYFIVTISNKHFYKRGVWGAEKETNVSRIGSDISEASKCMHYSLHASRYKLTPMI